MGICSFCRKPLAGCKLMVCLHSACVPCLKTAPRCGQDRKKISCPLCNEQTTLPSENPDDVLHLPDDLMESLPEATTATEGATLSRGLLVCAECDPAETSTGLVSHQCVTCSDFLCELHSSTHPLSPITLGHGVQPLDGDVISGITRDTQSLGHPTHGHGQAPQVSEKRPPLCIHHAFPVQEDSAPASRESSGRSSQDAAGTFCITCGEVLCRSCQMEGTHSADGHELVTLTQAEQQQRGELKRMLPQVACDVLPQLMTAKSHINRAVHDFDKSVQEIEDRVEQTASLLIGRIQEEKRQQLQQLHRYHAENRQVLCSQEEDLSNALDKINRASRFGTALLDRASGARFLHDTDWAMDIMYLVQSKMPSGESDAASQVTADDGCPSYEAALAKNALSTNQFDVETAADASSRRVAAPASSAAAASPVADPLSSLTSAMSFRSAVVSDQYVLEPLRSPRISFVDYSDKSMSADALLGRLSQANIDQRKCSLRPAKVLSKGDVYGVGDVVAFKACIATADGSPVGSAEEIGLEIKAVRVGSETVSAIPCEIGDVSKTGEFLVTLTPKEPGNVSLYASIDQSQLPDSPACIPVGSYGLRFDRVNLPPRTRVSDSGHSVAMTSSGNAAFLGSEVFKDGTHRWRVKLGGLGGPDFVVLGVCRPPFPTSYALNVSAYTTVLGWTSRSQTFIKGAMKTIQIAEWREEDVIQFEVNYTKRSLSMVNCRSGDRSDMVGAIKTETVPFFYLFNSKHTLRLMPVGK